MRGHASGSRDRFLRKSPFPVNLLASIRFPVIADKAGETGMTERTIQPWLKWYPQDWRADPALHSCSLAARGLWIELIGFMHEAHPYGLLLIGGNQPSNATIGRLVGVHHNVVTALVTELVTKGVAGVSPSGVIYSRRMLRDHDKALKNKENGAKGGNPVLLETVNPPDKAKRLEARVQSPEEEVSVAPAPVPAKRSKRKPQTTIPDDFILTGPRVQVAVDKNLDAEATFQDMRRKAIHRQTVSADWDIYWVIWCEKQRQINHERPQGRGIAFAINEDGSPVHQDE
jgi:hypothetical protein